MLLRSPLRLPLGLAAAMVATLSTGAATATPAEAAFVRLKQTQPSARVVWGPTARPRLLSGLRTPTTGATPKARALAFLASHTDLLAASGLTFVDAAQRRGRSVVRFEQRHGDLPVLDRALVVTLDADGAVRSVSDSTTPLKTVRPATIDEAAARALAIRSAYGEGVEVRGVAVKRVVLATGNLGVEGYEVHLSRAPVSDLRIVRIDAAAGRVLSVRNGLVH